ncbi:AChain A, pyruvate, phosphate dikinase, chloroplastic, partial [Tanacetum coccineum]
MMKASCNKSQVVKDLAKVMANADTPNNVLTARNNGAQGIGLCRTEHMISGCGCCSLLLGE